MKQQFFGLFLLVSLGMAGVALSQPKVVSFGAARLGIRLTSETAQFPAPDEFEPFELVHAKPVYVDKASKVDDSEVRFPTVDFPAPTNLPQNDPDHFPPNDSLHSQCFQPFGERPNEPPVSNFPTYPVYEAVHRESETISDDDFEFAYGSIPLTAEITTVSATAPPTTTVPPTANYASFDSMEGDFAAFNQNLTLEPAFTGNHSTDHSAEPLEEWEETVLYQPPQRTQHEPQSTGSATGRNEIANPRRPIAAPSGSGPFADHHPSANPPTQNFYENFQENLQNFQDYQNFPAIPVVPTNAGVDSRFHVEPNLVEIVAAPGAETVGRVGTEYILAADILPEAKKIAYLENQDFLKKLPPEERQKITEQELQERQEAIVQQVFPMILEEYVRFTLLYCDFASGRKREEIQPLEKRLGDSFEEHELPKLMKQFEAGNRMELNNTLEKLIGSSIEREKALFVRKTFGQIMMGQTIKEAEGECTYEEMLHYYDEHKADFFHRARARWLQLTVNITPSLPDEEAREKIAWMGNHVVGGIPFEQVARDHSDGLTAGNGGFNDWVSKGSLVSNALEQAIFQGRIGVLSPVIEDRNALHIVKVLEREEEHYTPFLQAQSEIKKRIKELRRNKKQAEYFEELIRRFHPETYQNSITSFSKPEPKAALPQRAGTSLHAR